MYIYKKAKNIFILFHRIRDLKTSLLGKLTAITGTITRSTEVRPELIQGSFLCMVCNKEIKDVEQQFKFTEPKICKNPNCHNTNKWQLQMESSIFCDFQKVTKYLKNIKILIFFK